ncbi:MAG: sulfatase-like hydrolase/transferase, partial [Verrucomicrobiales bacterium]|nr:sulfatase-like hydrolase/transferase [Verrucomicrobiales bacterium]
MRKLLLSFCLPAFLSLPTGSVGQTDGQRPNILFILADDLGWGDLSCYGHPELKTPNLDGLAAEGRMFTQFYVNAPACSPSRAAFLTGRYPGRLGIHAHIAGPDRNSQRGIVNFLDPEVVTLMDLMKGAGYATGHFGKWHLGIGEGAPEPSAYGVDDSVVLQGNGKRINRGPVTAEFWQNAPTLVADEVVRFLEEHRDQRWFINYSTLVPHAPLNPTGEQMEPYRRYSAGKQAPFAGATQVYYAAVSELDRQIGRVLAKLEELGMRENTLVVFTSDNGPEDIRAFNAAHSGVGSTGPFRGRKRSLYEGGIREPLILRWPGRIPAKTVDDSTVLAAIDFLPTLAELCDLPLKKETASGLDGQDMSEAWLGK